ncbi:hypothetical protein NDU88_003417 [Pleurodeles waltl]|uniref:Uncharacterized protein n=1 Tax=Pleurodeles waltl TaxID=8319 RepID=A0AAV7MSE0_PLEWA|nr:hypothetical protein NDU88_003417 [Pleurodeles waltl]
MLTQTDRKVDDEENAPQVGARKETSLRRSGEEGEEQTEAQKHRRRVGACHVLGGTWLVQDRDLLHEDKEKTNQEQEDGEDADSRWDSEGRNQRDREDEEKTPQAGTRKEMSLRNSRAEGVEQTKAEKRRRRVGARRVPGGKCLVQILDRLHIK